jgi:hypothetical protein
LGIDNLCLQRIEDKEPNHSAQVEHSPRLSAIVSDIGASHIAGYEDRIRIVRANGWIEHGATAAGTFDLEISRSNCKAGTAQQKERKNQKRADVTHLIVSFAFDMFA